MSSLVASNNNKKVADLDDGAKNEDNDVSNVTQWGSFNECASFGATCPICYQRFTNFRLFREHHYSTHVIPGRPKYQCTVCGKNNTSWTNYVAHFPMHSGPVCERQQHFAWGCTAESGCNKRSSSKANLIKHITKVHQMQLFEVPESPVCFFA